MEDRIHIISYPGPDRSVSDKSIKDNTFLARKYRNRRIGEFLKDLQLTEGRNTGIPKIKRALKHNGSREPEFETNDERDYFITTIYIHDGFKKEKKLEDKDQNIQYVTQDEIKNIEKNNYQSEVTEEALLDFCKEAKSLKEIMQYFNYRDRKSFKESYIDPLIKQNKLKLNSDKLTSSKQKYISNL